MLKIGGYGFLRFSLPMLPDGSRELAWLVIFMSLTAVVYIGFIALVQKDMKKLVAYSSIAHMGFVTLGFFLVYPIIKATGSSEGSLLGLQGGMVQMMSHGFISGAMFLCIGVLYDRMHTRDITAYGGVSNRMPWFAALFVLFAMANTGLPGTSGFVGEFMVILTSFKANFWIAFLGATTLVIGAAYTLWLVKRVIFGHVVNDNVAALTDINKRETFILASLAIMVLLLGLWPEPLVHVMNDSLRHVIEQATTSKLVK
jgi:NADH-quinone oxidoreductase subunit M